MEFLDLKSSLALWMTMAVALVTLLTPVVRGLLQGAQKFGPLGWTALSDGVIRFGAALIVLLARAVLNPGTLESCAIVVFASCCADSKPFSVKTFAVLGPMPAILVSAVVIFSSASKRYL